MEIKENMFVISYTVEVTEDVQDALEKFMKDNKIDFQWEVVG